MEAKTQGIEVLTPALSLDKDIAVNEEFNIHFKVRVGPDTVISNGTIAKYTIMSQYQGLNKNFEVEHLIGSLVSQNLESAGPFPMDIPDNNATGVSAKIDNGNNFKLDDIKVRVKITHTYIGDLEITLITPSGKQIKLHSKSGGSQDNIDCIYGDTCQSAEPLTVLKGENAKGTFTLKVTDRAGSDKGSIEYFGLSISGYAQN
jgi:subtilisin-like proprotein convertase family protein